MKAESRTVDDLFKPIVIEITIENERELTMLFHRMNMSFREVQEHSSDRLVTFEDINRLGGDEIALYLQLEKHMKRLDLIKRRNEV